MPSHLEALAQRVRTDPFFLACALEGYARSEGLDDDGLAAALGCDRETLTMLRLCRAPDHSRFKEDMDLIASRFGVNREVLTSAVRYGQAILAMVRQPDHAGGTVIAARDDDRPKSGEETPP